MNLPLHDFYVLAAGAGFEPARERKVLRVNFIDIEFFRVNFIDIEFYG